MPEKLRTLHPKFGTPWIGIIVFGGIAIIPILPGKADFLGNLYAFGAMLSFTVAHIALLKLRWSKRDAVRPYRSPGNIRFGTFELPILAVIGGLGTLAAFLVVAARNLGGISYAGFGWLLVGTIAYPIARKKMGLDLTTTYKVDIPQPVVSSETEYESIIVWFDAARFNEDTLATAARLAARRGRAINIIVTVQVPNSSPLSSEPTDLHDKAGAILDQARVMTRGRAKGTIVPVRSGQEGRVIVDTCVKTRARAVILAVPRGGAARSGFGRALETVLAERPCRVIVDTPAPSKIKATDGAPASGQSHSSALRVPR